MLCWKSLQGWLNSAVCLVITLKPNSSSVLFVLIHLLFVSFCFQVWAEYLKQGEAENIVREWSEALGGAGIDYLENKGCNFGSNNSLGGGQYARETRSSTEKIGERFCGFSPKGSNSKHHIHCCLNDRGQCMHLLFLMYSRRIILHLRLNLDEKNNIHPLLTSNISISKLLVRGKDNIY